MGEPTQRGKCALPTCWARMQILWHRTPWPLAGMGLLFFASNAIVPQPGVFVLLPNLLLTGAVLSLLQGANGEPCLPKKMCFLHGVRAFRAAFEELSRFIITVLLVAFMGQIILLVVEHYVSAPISISSLPHSVVKSAHSWMQKGFRNDLVAVVGIAIPGIIPALYLAMKDGMDVVDSLRAGLRAVTENSEALPVFFWILPLAALLAFVYLSTTQNSLSALLTQVIFTLLWLFTTVFGYVFSDQIFQDKESDHAGH